MKPSPSIVCDKVIGNYRDEHLHRRNKRDIQGAPQVSTHSCSELKLCKASFTRRNFSAHLVPNCEAGVDSVAVMRIKEK